MKRELNDYQAANLRWLLRNIKTRLPGLDTGDWFGELLFMTEGASGANAGDVEFDQIVKHAEFVQQQARTPGTDIPKDGPGSHRADPAEMRAQAARADEAERRAQEEAKRADDYFEVLTELVKQQKARVDAAEKALAEYKQAVAHKLHFDMNAILKCGTPRCGHAKTCHHGDGEWGCHLYGCDCTEFTAAGGYLDSHKAIIGREVISEPGAGIEITQLHPSEEAKRGLSVGNEAARKFTGDELPGHHYWCPLRDESGPCDCAQRGYSSNHSKEPK